MTQPARRRLPTIVALLALLAVLGLLVAACDDGGGGEGGDDTSTPADTAEDVSEVDLADTTADTAEDDAEPLPEGPSVVFDLAAVGAGDFFAFPYPNALRVTADGAPDVAALLDAPGALATSLLDEIEAHVRGFSPQGAVYFQLEAALDPASLPQSVDASVAGDASVFLLNFEPESPAYLERHPVRVHFRAEATSVSPANLLVVEPVPGQPLRPGERYVAVLGRALALADGSPIGAQPQWEAARVSVLPPTGVLPEVHAQVRDLLAELGDAGVNVADIVVASPFVTGDPGAAFDALYDTFDDAPFAPPTSFAEVERTAALARYEGTFDLIEFVELDAPTTPGSLLSRGADGAPEPVRTLDGRFSLLTAPEPPMDVVSYPLVMVSPPAGADHVEWATTLGSAMLAQAPVAVIAYEPPLSGMRGDGLNDPAVLVDQIATSNPLGWRDLVLHGVSDQIQFHRLIQVLTIPAEISPSGVQLEFWADPIVATGIGLGGQSLALQTGAWRALDSVLLSQVGGGLASQLVARDGAAAALATSLGAAGDTLDATHPLVSLLLQPALDLADPVYVAERAILAPIGVPKDIFMTMGTADTRVSPQSVETLAVALGVPPISPLPSGSGALWAAAGLAPVELDVQANLSAESPDCTRDPCQVTAGALPLPLGHELLLTDADSVTRWLIWSANAFVAAPIITGPP